MELHLRCENGDVARYVLTPGSVERADRIASHLSQSRKVIDSGAYRGYTGEYKGVRVTVCSSGIGGPSAAIAFEELSHLGCDTFVRVGSCGVFQDWQKPGDVIIATGCVRTSGTPVVFLPVYFPAIPSHYVTEALLRAASVSQVPVTVGLGVTGDVFYSPPRDTQRAERRQLLLQVGAVFGEMESETLFVLGLYHGWRTGAVFAADSTVEVKKVKTGESAFRAGEESAICIALDALSQIAEEDLVALRSPTPTRSSSQPCGAEDPWKPRTA